ncbi:diguanylate cyclase [Paenibacillus frigoriresistens]|uniref:diguanylate cyclase domain-containing protein n=1 Tax=Paenibacillus alginolyticus TaxID=59839 RepID=UPI001562F22F|nr:diguanylate cyclase [Paenibacillus frigoriresistens]NRF96066.1 diguanylate cyclase [Paenibacillus frigoriresistens]
MDLFHLFNNLEEHILILNKDGIITFSNHSLNTFLDFDSYGTSYSFVQMYGPSSEISKGIHDILNGVVTDFSCKNRRSSEQEENWSTIRVTPITAKENGEIIIDGAVILYFNITNQIKLEQSLRRSEEQYRLIAENSRDTIKIIDLEGNIDYASPSHKYIFGHDASEYLGRVVFDSIYPDDLSKFKNAIGEVLKNKEPVVVELRKQHKEGHWIWLEASCSPIINLDGEVRSIVLVTRDVNDRKEYEKKLEYMAYHDFLTGLYNRRKFKQMIEILLEQAIRKNRKLAFIMMDLDHFKWINDNLGHDAGDIVLQEFSKRLMDCIRDGDIIGRLIGDEFAILMNDIRGEREIYELIDRITVSVEKPFAIHSDSCKISTSIGVSIFPEHGRTSSQLMKCADVALYKVKRGGRKNYKFYKSGSNEYIKR